MISLTLIGETVLEFISYYISYCTDLLSLIYVVLPKIYVMVQKDEKSLQQI